MNSLPRPLLALLIIAFLAPLLLASCNTARGFGRDVQRTGEKIENVAR